MFRILLVIALSGFLAGCKTSEEQLQDLCLEGLRSNLKTYATYGGWSLEDARVRLAEMVPAEERNKKYNTDMFWSFEVVISGFTLKNRFNADVQSIATCSGYVSKYSPEDDFNVPDSHILLKYMLNGQKLGI